MHLLSLYIVYNVGLHLEKVCIHSVQCRAALGEGVHLLSLYIVYNVGLHLEKVCTCSHYSV